MPSSVVANMCVNVMAVTKAISAFCAQICCVVTGSNSSASTYMVYCIFFIANKHICVPSRFNYSYDFILAAFVVILICLYPLVYMYTSHDLTEKESSNM